MQSYLDGLHRICRAGPRQLQADVLGAVNTAFLPPHNVPHLQLLQTASPFHARSRKWSTWDMLLAKQSSLAHLLEVDAQEDEQSEICNSQQGEANHHDGGLAIANGPQETMGGQLRILSLQQPSA